MKKAITCLLSLFMVGCSNGNASYTQISMDKAIQEMQNSTGYELVDVRTKKEYESGHIPGAINIVNEEAALFFDGQKSARDVAGVIQSRVQIYVDENQ